MPECFPKPRMVGLEADLRRLEDVDEPPMVLGGNVSPEPALDDGEEAHQLRSVFVAPPRAFDGGGELVQESSQVVVHTRNRIAAQPGRHNACAIATCFGIPMSR